MKPQDFVKLTVPSSPELSPDGQTAVFTAKSVNHEKNSYSSAIFINNLKTSKLERFTQGKGMDYNPKFSPDGKYLAFLSTRSEKGQVFVISLEGGEASQVTKLPTSIEDYRWSNDSKKLLVLSLVSKDELTTILEPKKKPSFILEPEAFESEKGEKNIKKDLEEDPRIITAGYYREGTSYLGNRFRQPFVVSLSQTIREDLKNEEEKDPVHIGEFGWHYSLGQFSKDDTHVYLSRIKDPSIERKHELVEVNIQKEDEYSILFTTSGFISNIEISPNGKKLLYEGNRDDFPDWIYDNEQIFLYDLETKPNSAICLTKDFFWSASQSRWFNDNEIVFLSNHDAKTIIEKLDVATNKISTILDKDQKINSFTVSSNTNIIIYEASTISEPDDVYKLQMETSTVSRITDTNSELKNDPQLGILKSFTFTRENTTMQGWLLLPPAYESQTKLPLVVDIHGGPAVMWSPHERTMWLEFHALVSAGYAVFFCNPRGSDGYGIDFRKSNHQNWGDLPGNDIIAGLDYVLKEYSFLDSSNVFVTGGSYGGYMTAWLVTHHDRFKAAVSQRGVYEFTAFAQTTDIPIWFELGYSYEFIDPERNTIFERDSPLFSIKNLNCPLMILHSENDHRVPVVNAEQLFWVGKRYGKTVEFVRYPRDGHELSRSGEPRHIIDRLNRIINWFDKFKD